MNVPALGIRKVTPILIVEEIEPSLALWTGTLGYEKQIEVPYDGRIGFVLLCRGGDEVMMQTRASLQADLPGIAKLGVGCVLYMDVASLSAAIAATAATPALDVIVPERETAYGARETFVRDPAGNVIGFAERNGAQEKG
jgi:hypothetical protein